jgi:hypothetical protein
MGPDRFSDKASGPIFILRIIGFSCRKNYDKLSVYFSQGNLSEKSQACPLHRCLSKQCNIRGQAAFYDLELRLYIPVRMSAPKISEADTR